MKKTFLKLFMIGIMVFGLIMMPSKEVGEVKAAEGDPTITVISVYAADAMRIGWSDYNQESATATITGNAFTLTQGNKNDSFGGHGISHFNANPQVLTTYPYEINLSVTRSDNTIDSFVINVTGASTFTYEYVPPVSGDDPSLTMGHQSGTYIEGDPTPVESNMFTIGNITYTDSVNIKVAFTADASLGSILLSDFRFDYTGVTYGDENKAASFGSIIMDPGVLLFYHYSSRFNNTADGTLKIIYKERYEMDVVLADGVKVADQCKVWDLVGDSQKNAVRFVGQLDNIAAYTDIASISVSITANSYDPYVVTVEVVSTTLADNHGTGTKTSVEGRFYFAVTILGVPADATFAVTGTVYLTGVETPLSASTSID